LYEGAAVDFERSIASASLERRGAIDALCDT